MIYESTISFELAQFRNAFQYIENAENEVFERLINYNLLLQYQPDAFNSDSRLLETISVGGGDDLGQDGIAIKINNMFISSLEELDSWVTNKKEKLTIEYFFIQSKYKPNTDCGELLKFIGGIREFFNDNSILPMNDNVRAWYEIRKKISSKEFIIHLRELPHVKCYFVSTANEFVDNHKDAYIATFKNEMRSRFSSFEFMQYGASDIVDIIKQNKSDEPLQILEDGIINFSRVEGIKNACIISCSAQKFIESLNTREGVIKKSIFVDNVRDFQGMNSVNTEMLSTIENEPQKFILFNNGITIVGTNFIEQSKILSIDNPQIVNGCQTCNVLFDAWKKGVDISSINLIVKVISTEDATVANDVVKGTNRQSIVYEEAFETTLPFHKNFEKFVIDYGNSIQTPMKIYYERRSKQYALNPNIEPYQRFNLKSLVQYTVAVLQEEPHNAHMHESQLVKKYKNIIFQNGESFNAYFSLAYAFLTLEKYLKAQNKEKWYNTYKSHLLLIYFLLVAGSKPNRKDHKQADEYANKILVNAIDEKQFQITIDEAKNILSECKDIWVNRCKRSPYAMKDVSAFTTLIIKKVKNEYLEWYIDKLSKTCDSNISCVKRKKNKSSKIVNKKHKYYNE
ncbi:MAG: AIPR family protein [Paludibacteraceae bacterium]|nr:AIPR family protein [Paludibacteraceae bacterium]